MNFKCTCGDVKDDCVDCMKTHIEKLESALKHCRMFIVDNKGYCQKRTEEVALIKETIDELI